MANDINGYCGGSALGFIAWTMICMMIGKDLQAIAYAILALVMVQFGVALGRQP